MKEQGDYLGMRWILAAFIAFIGLVYANSKPSVLVIGGSGRVGGSAVRSLYFGDRALDIVVGGRSASSYGAFLERNKIQDGAGVHFQAMDIYNEAELESNITPYDLIIHTGGPFQGLKVPNVLESAMRHGKRYVDVMDDVELSRIARSDKYQEMAKGSGGSGVISAGIWPGGSSLLAQQSIATAGGPDKVEKVTFDFFTAGSGNAGTTIITATFLILGEDVLVYEEGQRVYKPSATDKKAIDFGPYVGKREVVRLNLIECESCYQSSGGKIGHVSTFFGTAPPFWNKLFAVMANLIPQKVLQNRDAMAKLAAFSMPMIRLIDRFVGSRNSIKVTVQTKDGKEGSAIMTHDDLEAAVGDSLAAFALGMLPSEGKGGTVPALRPGVFYPEEMPPDYRERVLAEIAGSALHYSPLR
jgi:saccharopine dehydrogenase-like NADP-dependent oxidoreductase